MSFFVVRTSTASSHSAMSSAVVATAQFKSLDLYIIHKLHGYTPAAAEVHQIDRWTTPDPRK
eukprot:COSAG06_NODE_70831_length_190_cov_14.615385_1_plen_61_part_10